MMVIDLTICIRCYAHENRCSCAKPLSPRLIRLYTTGELHSFALDLHLPYRCIQALAYEVHAREQAFSLYRQ